MNSSVSPVKNLSVEKKSDHETVMQQLRAKGNVRLNQVLNYVTAPLAACCSTRAPPRASVLLTKKGELPVCNASYKGDIHELQVPAHTLKNVLFISVRSDVCKYGFMMHLKFLKTSEVPNPSRICDAPSRPSHTKVLAGS